MQTEIVRQFAKEWIEAWNSHNLDRILFHYADSLEFHSPLIPLLKFNPTGKIDAKMDLAEYFKIGLKKYPDLHFELHHCFIGLDSFVLYYTSVNGKLAAEAFQLNEQNKAVKVRCHYVNQ